MIRSHAFQPSVTLLESRLLPTSTIYLTTFQNAEQDSYVAQADRADNPVVFLGDSITYNWGTATRSAPGSATFTSDFAPLGAANFGIYGDTTADLLARIEGGDLAGKPKLAVLMIGVNNLLTGQTPLEAATGVAQVVQAIKAASPQTTILLLGVLPTDVAAINPEIPQLNALISVLGRQPGVLFENPGVQLLGADGAAQPALLMDVVHPDAAGYALIANAIDGTVVALLRASEVAANPVVATPPAPKVEAASVAVPRPAKSTPIPVVAAADPAVDLYLVPPPSPAPSTEAVDPAMTPKAKSFASELITVPTS